MSSSPVIKADSVQVQSFAMILPTVVQSSLHMAVSREGRGGRTANQLEQLRETITNQAYDEGYARGLDVGFKDGHENAYAKAYADAAAEANAKETAYLEEFKNDLDMTVASVLEALESWTRSAEEKVTDIVSHIAREILQSEMKLSRESILGIVKQAIAEATHSANARIRINPFDAPTLNEHKPAILAAARTIRNIDFVEDVSIIGGCIVETDGGIIDATVEGKLKQFEDEMDGAA